MRMVAFTSYKGNEGPMSKVISKPKTEDTSKQTTSIACVGEARDSGPGKLASSAIEGGDVMNFTSGQKAIPTKNYQHGIEMQGKNQAHKESTVVSKRPSQTCEHPLSQQSGGPAGQKKSNQYKKLNPFERWPGHPEFYKLLIKAAKIHSSKNQDYGGGDPLGNFMLAQNIGIEPWEGVLVRMSDKWARITSLVKRMKAGGGGPKVEDESIEDTLIDLANYALLCIVVRKEANGNGETE